jgi:hypothetical protein
MNEIRQIGKAKPFKRSIIGIALMEKTVFSSRQILSFIFSALRIDTIIRNRRYSVLFLVMLFLNGLLHAQDTIVKKSGTRILAKVVEVGTEKILFHKASMPDGPVYSEFKNEISYIRYETGLVDTFGVAAPQFAEPQSVGKISPPSEDRKEIKDHWISRYGSRDYFVGNHRVNERSLVRILMAEKNPAINNCLKEWQNKKEISVECNVMKIPVIVFSGVCGLFAMVTIPAARSVTDEQNIVKAFGLGYLGVGGAISLKVLAVISRKQSLAALDKAIDIYNGDLPAGNSASAAQKEK